ncbi:MAG: hypothetical protein AKCLJLPJ_00292 [Fimbriimonadales bacterium]|nr:MAG: hypothetical protein EDM73_01410 [Armatimonadota bacterium]MBV6502248.1 hypothetical protein [Fimbriimonadales bacterium]MCE7899085.1 hypothetical protein [Armatimonadetes bacterium ATM1]MDL1927540.1 hypothetical protein [Fimbriimonadia bacterium ATM]MBC6969817.1 hypothetical protein [Armatimonadota bacterium]
MRAGIAVLCLTLLVLGCKSPSVVGKWSVDAASDALAGAKDAGVDVTWTLDLRADGSFEMSSKAKSPTANALAKFSGTYVADGESLTLTTAEENGLPVDPPRNEVATLSPDRATLTFEAGGKKVVFVKKK